MTALHRPLLSLSLALPHRPTLLSQARLAHRTLNSPPQLHPQPLRQQQPHRSHHTALLTSTATTLNPVPQPPAHNHHHHTTTTTTYTHLHTQTRPASTAARHRRLLRLPPADFLNGPTEITGSSGKSRSAFALQRAAQRAGTDPGIGAGTDHVVFTPAPSAPNAYHTPPKFLPRGDIRRRLFEQQQQAQQRSASTSASPSSTPALSHHLTTTPIWPSHLPLPPPVRPPYEKKYHLTPTDMAEIRRLRAEDEGKWTRRALAQRFQCSQLLVGMVAQASEERVRETRRMAKRAEERWGVRRRRAREERGRRREGWGRGD